ncbi:hypothetical protein RFI_30257 [Reticulomyxa filosa]|uniref:RING-type domain-containing protein n=1 Tax=Reticulomyxa filosa TaxID=46433 RepID=X6LZS7_RETFI|nr:hypothetical protein RFI_30257 [Reticulomyxa filosa]|eukprot:ETO07134.1 hypothetical protein RFI_30257 [Reticulomyxa filosa]
MEKRERNKELVRVIYEVPCGICLDYLKLKIKDPIKTSLQITTKTTAHYLVVGTCIISHLKLSGNNHCPLCRSRFEMIQTRKIEDKIQKIILELFQINQLTENDKDDINDSNMRDILSRVKRTNSLFSAINTLPTTKHFMSNNGFINCALCDHFFHVKCINPDLFIQCQECLMLSNCKSLF